jgi:DNA-binding transcriptional LysR family regulator
MNLQSIDLNLLVAFEALMDERNVTRAAKRIGLSQPAMSNALARLRRTFDDSLLVRTSNGMAPTPAAQALIEPVRLALSQLRGILQEKPAFDPSATRHAFHVLANDYAEVILLAPLARQVRSAAPRVSIRVHRPANVFLPPPATSLAGSFDLAIGFFPDTLSLDAGVRSELLFEEENVCITSGRHPSIRGRLSIRQYASAEHVAVFYKSEGPGIIDTLLAQKGLARSTVMQVPHFCSVPFLVASSDLIATVPKLLALRFSKALNLQILAVPLAIPAFRLTMLWHQRLDSDPAQSWMRSTILETAALVMK